MDCWAAAIPLLLIGGLAAAYTPTADIVELDERFLETKDRGHWLVMLYAPWCGHCKRILPTFDQVGHSLANSDVQVAKLDCTKYPNLASKLKVTGYPSIRVFRHGVSFEYFGERSKEALLEFTEKVVGPPVRHINDKAEFQNVREKHSKGVFFLLVSDATVRHSLRDIYEALAERMFTKEYFYKIHPDVVATTNIQVANVPAVMCFKDGKYISFLKDSEEEELELWFQNERWTEMPLVKQETIHEIGSCCNKYLVVFVLDFVEKRKQNSAVKRATDLAKAFLQRYADKTRDRFQFVWFDGNALANSFLLRTVPVPSLFVLNYSSYEHYLPKDDVLDMNEEALLMFLKNVDAGAVPARGGRGVIQRIKQLCFETFSSILLMFFNQPLLACCLFGLPLGIASVICYTVCSTDVSFSTEEVYNESDESDSDHWKAD